VTLDRRDYGRDREDDRRKDNDRREGDRRDGRRKDDGRDEKRETGRRDDDRERDRDIHRGDHSRRTEPKPVEKPVVREVTMKDRSPQPRTSLFGYFHITCSYLQYVAPPVSSVNGLARLNLDPDMDEEGETVEDTAPEDTDAIMAAMGMAGFGSTKVCDYSVVTNARLTVMEGQASRWESGGSRKREKDQNMETVYESVCDMQRLDGERL
jgi:U4/U6.U5 tri-snRNP-associated protein 3